MIKYKKIKEKVKDKMKEDYRRHDISDRAWALLEPHLPGRRGAWGRAAQDNRRFINAVIWILRTGAPWRDLPPEYGDWKNTEIKVFGKNYLIYSFRIRILNGS